MNKVEDSRPFRFINKVMIPFSTDNAQSFNDSSWDHYPCRCLSPKVRGYIWSQVVDVLDGYYSESMCSGVSFATPCEFTHSAKWIREAYAINHGSTVFIQALNALRWRKLGPNFSLQGNNLARPTFSFICENDR